MNKVTDVYESYVIEQHRVRNTRTNAVVYHYVGLKGPLFVVDINQIVRCMSKKAGMDRKTIQILPIYIPVSYSLLEEIMSTFGKPLKLPRVRISRGSKLLAVHREMIQKPVSSLTEVISLMNNLKTANMVDDEQQPAEVEIMQNAFRLVAQVYTQVVGRNISTK